MENWQEYGEFDFEIDVDHVDDCLMNRIKRVEYDMWRAINESRFQDEGKLMVWKRVKE